MFREIDVKDLTENPFTLIGDKWLLITAGTPDNCNTMTASWGGVGVMWGTPMATIYVRPQRYTKEFIDSEEYFTLSFFNEEQRANLTYCGKISGRDQDKIAHCGYTVIQDKAPYFAEAELVFVCRKRFSQPLDGTQIPADIREKWYPESDFHHLYFGEIITALVKE